MSVTLPLRRLRGFVNSLECTHRAKAYVPKANWGIKIWCIVGRVQEQSGRYEIQSWNHFVPTSCPTNSDLLYSCNATWRQDVVPATELFWKNGRVTKEDRRWNAFPLHVPATCPIATCPFASQDLQTRVSTTKWQLPSKYEQSWKAGVNLRTAINKTRV